jgi:hypothetical protein
MNAIKVSEILNHSPFTIHLVCPKLVMISTIIWLIRQDFQHRQPIGTAALQRLESDQHIVSLPYLNPPRLFSLDEVYHLLCLSQPERATVAWYVALELDETNMTAA